MNQATFRLVLVTALWGVSFPMTRAWQLASRDAPGGMLLSALTLVALRMTLAVVLLALWQPRVIYRPTAREHLAGLLIGLVFFVGFALQTWALAMTTPALSAFFTSIASAWVPLLVLCGGGRVAPLTLLGLAVGLAGCAVLVEGWKMGVGEGLTLLASFLFAVELVMLDRLGKTMSPSHFSAAFLFVNAAGAALGAVLVALLGPGLGAWASWTAAMLSRGPIVSVIVLLAIFPTVIAFHWMNTYQPQVPASRAALIYLLEPVFTSVVSLAVHYTTGDDGYDKLTLPLVLGGVLILVGNLLVELKGPAAEEAPGGSSTRPHEADAS